MLFCPSCGSCATISPGERLSCSCGYSGKIESAAWQTHTEKLNHAGTIRVADATKNEQAVFDHTCRKCGHGKAQLIERGIQYSDEDDLSFYKCGRCGNVEQNDCRWK